MDDDWNEEVTSVVKVAPRQMSIEEQAMRGMKKLEQTMLDSSMRVITDTCNFDELDPDNIDAIPEKWIEEHGELEAKRKHRVAKAGWLPNKEAPIAIQTATKIAIGIIRARATEKSGPKILNIQPISMVAPKQRFEVIDVDDGDF
ncbi:MAG: hypothetical protein ACYTBJ_17555 [Planctomycetota bacterium]|jgi:hypothetical protein